MNCKNCDTKLENSKNYCFECGAKVITKRLTFKSICAEIGDKFFNLDNKLLKTFLDLFSKPDDVIVNFINGTRKKHVNVIQYFAISLTLVGIQVFLMNTFFKDAMNMDALFGNKTYGKDNPFSPENFNYEEINNYQSLIYVLSVPLSAFSTWFTYFIVNDRRYNFTEHIVINLYYSAQVIIISSLTGILFLCLGIDYLVISSFITIITLIYLLYVLHKVFKTKLLESISRFILIMLIYAIFFILIIICSAVIGYIIAKK
ncbi:DUF3667 domain-containing protein [Algibacter sp. R77976]|uniref:DUF3667 domain-containing protein n=1 Tax=Algibacter sp. R77976 TaxID=3093873 RepID=UPI0037C69A24